MSEPIPITDGGPLWRAPFEEFDLKIRHDSGLSAAWWDGLLGLLGEFERTPHGGVVLHQHHGLPLVDVVLSNVRLGTLEHLVDRYEVSTSLPIIGDERSRIEFRERR